MGGYSALYQGGSPQKGTFFQASSGVDPYFVVVFRGEYNFMKFFKGKKKR